MRDVLVACPMRRSITEHNIRPLLGGLDRSLMRRGLLLPQGDTGRAHRAPLAEEGNQEFVSALPAADPGQAMGEDAAIPVVAEFAFHMRRRRRAIESVTGKRAPRREVVLNGAIQQGAVRPPIRHRAILGRGLLPGAYALPKPGALGVRRGVVGTGRTRSA